MHLNHGFAKDLNKRLAGEARGSKSGRDNSDNPSPKLTWKAEIKVSMCPYCHSYSCPNSKAVKNPGFHRARRGWLTDPHRINTRKI